jgi:hypothetical protein
MYIHIEILVVADGFIPRDCFTRLPAVLYYVRNVPDYVAKYLLNSITKIMSNIYVHPGNT